MTRRKLRQVERAPFFHGDCAHYDVSASTRETDLEVSMLYPVPWDLLGWARGRGATWFDFGGISSVGRNSDDPLGAVSDFERRFGPEEGVVAQDWAFESRPLRARLARLAQAARARAREVARRRAR